MIEVRPGRGLTVAQVLKELEVKYRDRELRLLEKGLLKEGLLVYTRKGSGGLDLINDPEKEVPDQTELVVAVGMEGG